MVLIRSSHALDGLLALLLRYTTLFGDDLGEDVIDFACHVGSITTDVEVCLLLEELVDFFCSLLQSVLDVDFLWSVTGEGGDDLEVIAEVLLECLRIFISQRSIS